MRPERPLVFVDLDDTLFQTARKMPEQSARHPISFDRNGEASGYMTPVQQSLVDWLLNTADVVPVTARSVEALYRVHLPFRCGAICAHGGIILAADGTLDSGWHGHMTQLLEAHQQSLPQLCEATLQIGTELGIDLRGWVVEHAHLRQYVVTKHNGSDDQVLATIFAQAQARGLLEGMTTHRNSNNLAFLPAGLDKRWAVQEWLRRDRAEHGERPVLGFGDSLTDLGFMQECQLWGTPARSQVASALRDVIHG